ncbi:MAG TPA: RNA 2',3'-cyclic phosphodiesterase [Gemmatales bacterium]|nr:RNA 2',3'-cyclic phosphodiesterase [Gemmatales bacterium]
MRLFTAIVIPSPVAQQLARLQPLTSSGIRLVKTEQIHLTLHFLGDTSLAIVQQELQGFSGPAFELTIDRLGSFPTAERSTTLWAGLQESKPLMELHSDIEARLVAAGYRPEKRAYRPHITLARCSLEVPKHVIQDFLAQQSLLIPMTFMVQEVVLFSSRLSEMGPTYQQENVYPLMNGNSQTPSKSPST